MPDRPTPQDQIRFLQQIQRLLSEGEFVATYKFALLHALADLAVIHGEDSGAPLTLTTTQIAEQFVELYWRQAQPYPTGHTHEVVVLRQNTGAQAAVVNHLVRAQADHGSTLARLRRHPDAWAKLLANVERTVREQPLWKLQNLGQQTCDFLYRHGGSGASITLRPGIAYCLRAFHDMLVDMFRGAWIRHIRRIQSNLDVMGETRDLSTFLFGSGREQLDRYRHILWEVQEHGCFYCDRRLAKSSSEVDHFVPWARYPNDLGHNFVLAHASCNRSKSDQLAGLLHLETWARRNEDRGGELAQRFDEVDLAHDLNATTRVAHWAYRQTEQAEGQVWLSAGNVTRLAPGWSRLLQLPA